MASRRTQCVRTCLLAVALVSTPLAARQDPLEWPPLDGLGDRAAYTVQRQSLRAADRPPLELLVVSKAEAAASAVALAESAGRAVARLDEWLGPLTRSRLVIVDAPWNAASASELKPGVVLVRTRWSAPARDRGVQREMIAGLAAQYWPPSSGQWFTDALALYTGGRAIDSLLEGSQFHADRYLGGFLSYPIRSVSLSPIARDARPRLRRYDELRAIGGGVASAQARRGASVLATAERYLGWPAMQQALAAFRARFPAAGSVAQFSAIVSEQSGRDLGWLFGEALTSGATLDYAVSDLSSTAGAGPPGQYDVRVTIRRLGPAVFGATAEAADPGTVRSLPVEVQFADGTAIRDWWDGRLEQGTLDYVSASPATVASLDPELMVLLDERRANNSVAVARPWNRLAARLTLNWAIWLQNAMLSFSGLA